MSKKSFQFVLTPETSLSPCLRASVVNHRILLFRSKIFPRSQVLTAVDDISFLVNEGEVFGSSGPNGAAKTTTINILCTLLSPTGGSAAIAGHDCVGRRTSTRPDRSYLQDTTLDTGLTAYEN